MQKTWVWSLGQEDPLEEGTATHSSIPAWRIPRTEGPGGSVHRVAKCLTGLSCEAQWLSACGHALRKLRVWRCKVLAPLAEVHNQGTVSVSPDSESSLTEKKAEFLNLGNLAYSTSAVLLCSQLPVLLARLLYILPLQSSFWSYLKRCLQDSVFILSQIKLQLYRPVDTAGEGEGRMNWESSIET